MPQSIPDGMLKSNCPGFLMRRIKEDFKLIALTRVMLKIHYYTRFLHFYFNRNTGIILFVKIQCLFSKSAFLRDV